MAFFDGVLKNVPSKMSYGHVSDKLKEISDSQRISDFAVSVNKAEGVSEIRGKLMDVVLLNRIWGTSQVHLMQRRDDINIQEHFQSWAMTSLINLYPYAKIPIPAIEVVESIFEELVEQLEETVKPKEPEAPATCIAGGGGDGGSGGGVGEPCGAVGGIVG